MKVLNIEAMKEPGDDALQFQGFEHEAGTSFFVAETTPGGGPSRHRHPYEEVFVVLRGDIEFIVDEQRQMVSSGSIAIVPANTWHEFRNRSNLPALMVNIHPVPRMITEWAQAT